MPLIYRSAAEWYTHTHAGQQEGKNQPDDNMCVNSMESCGLLLGYISNSS